MSLYSLSGDFYTPIGFNFSNVKNFDQQCAQCYHSVIQLGYKMNLCDNPRYTSTCPHLNDCERQCYKDSITSQLSPGKLYCGVDLNGIGDKCQSKCIRSTNSS